jgi:hypothetical protein
MTVGYDSPSSVSRYAHCARAAGTLTEAPATHPSRMPEATVLMQPAADSTGKRYCPCRPAASSGIHQAFRSRPSQVTKAKWCSSQ